MIIARPALRFIVRSVPEREVFLPMLQAEIPSLEIVRDKYRNSRETFLRALAETGDSPAVHFEDDVTPTANIEKKLRAVIEEHPDSVIQFFSLRKNDLKLGPRLMPGRTFLMMQCWYLPAGFARALHDFHPHWHRRFNPVGGNDWMPKAYLAEHKMTYWLHVPSLVQHRQVVSAIDPRRSSKRFSPSFKAI